MISSTTGAATTKQTWSMWRARSRTLVAHKPRNLRIRSIRAEMSRTRRTEHRIWTDSHHAMRVSDGSLRADRVSSASMSDPATEKPPVGLSRWAPVSLASVIGLDPPPEDLPDGGEQSASSDPNVGRIFGKYRIVRRIGAGGMAVVYLAHALESLNREVAIKVLTPESTLSTATISRFIKEAQAISLARHPNVVQLIEPPGWTDDGQVYLVMELLTGKPLSEILGEMVARGEVFAWEQLAPLILQICRALHAAHKQKIVHRDMKPSNCFCTELDDDPWHVKVLDFGIAKVQSSGVSDDSIETPLTQDGMFIGTPHYAAPEISDRRPETGIDGRADIFSLGVMMYQCLTGTLPFEQFRKDKLAAIFKTARERPESLRSRAPARDIPPEVDTLVMRAMEIDAARRYSSVLEFAVAIRTTLGGTRGANSGDAIPELTPPSSASSGLEVPPPSSIAVQSATAAQSTSAARSAAVDLGVPARAGASSGGAGSPAPMVEHGTPPPPGIRPSERPVDAPTSVQRLGPSTRTTVIAAGLMVVGVGVLLVLIGMESFKTTTPRAIETRQGSTAQPSNQKVQRPSDSPPPPALPPKQVVSPVLPPGSAVVTNTEAEKASASASDEVPSPSEKATPRVPVESQAAQSRKRSARKQLDTLTGTRAVLDCLPLSLSFADGVFDELPVIVQLDGAGKANATAASRKVDRRLPNSADACILRVINQTAFTAGDGPLTMTHTLRFD